jgi:F-type H+-transporting ATPase subunit delta
VGGYATARFEELPTDRLEEIEDEIFRFARIVDTTPPLRGVLCDAGVPLAVRTQVAHDLLGGKVQPATLALVGFVLRGGRPRDFVGTLDWLVEQTARARGWRVAHVRTGADIDDEQRRRIADTLSGITGAPVELQVTTDASLIGGAVVQIGDLLVDATARGRLNRLREHLVPPGWEETEGPDHGDAAHGPRAEGAQ